MINKEHERKGQLSNSLLQPDHRHMTDVIRSVLGSNKLQLLKIQTTFSIFCQYLNGSQNNVAFSGNKHGLLKHLENV